MIINLYCEVVGKPTIKVLVDGQAVDHTANWSPDEYGNIGITVAADILELSTVSICVAGLSAGDKFNIVEIVADGVGFGIVTFMCASVNGKISSQLNADGVIDVELGSPSWSYWCAKFNQFNYKDYPFGSAD